MHLYLQGKSSLCWNNIVASLPQEMAGEKINFYQIKDLPFFAKKDTVVLSYNEIPLGRGIKKVVVLDHSFSLRDQSIYPKNFYKKLQSLSPHDLILVSCLSLQEELSKLLTGLKIDIFNPPLVIWPRVKELLDGQYFLYVGPITAAATLKDIVLSMYHRQEFLVVVGEKSSYQQDIAALAKKVKVKIMFSNDLSVDNLAKLYQGAQAYVNAWPGEEVAIYLLYALFFALPIISVHSNGLYNFASPSSIYFNKEDANLGQLIDLLDDPILVEHMKLQGLKFVQQFQAEHFTAQMMNWLRFK